VRKPQIPAVSFFKRGRAPSFHEAQILEQAFDTVYVFGRGISGTRRGAFIFESFPNGFDLVFAGLVFFHGDTADELYGKLRFTAYELDSRALREQLGLLKGLPLFCWHAARPHRYRVDCSHRTTSCSGQLQTAGPVQELKKGPDSCLGIMVRTGKFNAQRVAFFLWDRLGPTYHTHGPDVLSGLQRNQEIHLCAHIQQVPRKELTAVGAEIEKAPGNRVIRHRPIAHPAMLHAHLNADLYCAGMPDRTPALVAIIPVGIACGQFAQVLKLINQFAV